MAYESGWVSIIELQDGQTVSDKFDSAFGSIDLALADIETKIPDGYFQFVPQDPEPAGITEGAMFYDLVSHSFVAINDIGGTRLNLGHEVVDRVSNATGTTLLEGTVVAVGGVDVNDDFEVIRADASILNTAVAFGMMTSEPTAGSVGLVTREGRINNVDTVGVATNGTLYLSDTAAGELTGTSPEISTVVGYVVKAQSAVGVKDGVIYVSPRSIISLPNVVAFMNQDIAWAAPVSLDSTPVIITAYDPVDTGSRVMSFNAVTGEITAPATGIYDVSIDFDSAFNDVGNAQIHCLIEVFDGTSVVAQYNKLVGRNAVSTNGSMTKTFSAVQDLNYTLRISCPDGTLSNFTLENVSFSMKSIDIR